MKENEKIWVVKDGYLALRNGTIFSLNWRSTGKCVEVKQSVNNWGYLQFSRNGTTIGAHRFIAECFIPNPQNLPCVNHKDENPSNNHVENLEWCDYKYNNNYGTRNKKSSESQKNDPQKSKKVLQFTKDGKFVNEWVSLREIERVLGFNIGCISDCCNGKRKSAYDFIWRYK